MRRSENAGMVLVRSIIFLIVVVIIGFVGFSIQGAIHHNTATVQVQKDFGAIMNQGTGSYHR